MVTRRDAKYVDAITKLIDREIEWLDGKDAINASSDDGDDKPGRGRRADSKGTQRRSGTRRQAPPRRKARAGCS